MHLELVDDPKSVHSSAFTPTLNESREGNSTDRRLSISSEAMTESRKFNLSFEITIRGRELKFDDSMKLMKSFGKWGGA